MTRHLGMVYGTSLLDYDFGREHPLRPARVQLTYELMRSLGFFQHNEVMLYEPRTALDTEVRLFHEEQYVDFVAQMSRRGEGFLDLGDTPAFKGCFEASKKVVGASLLAVDLVMQGEVAHAINFSGGLHHAHRDRASGFCIFNDPAVCVSYLKERYGIKRVMYVDIDAHHGDGVMYGYYSDPALLDIDFHEDGRYLFPGTGFVHETGEGDGQGVKVNIPLPPSTGDDQYLYVFSKIIEPLVNGFKPDFILLQCGADAHVSDPLTHLALTTRSYREVSATIHAIAHKCCGGRLIAFGGGGYNLANVPRCWTAIAKELAQFECSDETPEEWRDIYRQTLQQPPPTKLSTHSTSTQRQDLDRKTASILQRVKEEIPLLREIPL